MKKFNKLISGALAALMIFTSVPIYATNDFSSETTSEITSEELSTEINSSEIETTEETSTSETATSETSEETPEIQDKPTVFVESDEDSEGTDNWELSTVFYDSSVNNGKTPLTSIDWDASDGGYDEGATRVITVQINYKNTNAVTTYQPGELILTIPNLSYNTNKSADDSAYWNTKIKVGANDSTHIGYMWNFTTATEPSTSQELFTFANANTIEEKSNFEGNIQIVYEITPKQEYENTYSNNNINHSLYNYIEQYENECIHSLSMSLSASLNNIITSNEIDFNYTRVYEHPWQYKTYNLTKTASKISSYDNLGDNPQNYIWVNYIFKYEYIGGSIYPNIEATNIYIKDISIPNECIVYDTLGNQIIKTNDYYKINAKSTSSSWAGPSILRYNMKASIYVGFPKSIYNNQSDNMIINNTAYLCGTYLNKQQEEILSSASTSVNLADFIFEYTGDLYGIKKTGSSAMRYQDIIADSGNYNIASYGISPSARWTGSLMTLKVGDDILYATDQNSNYIRLTDDDYYIEQIRIMKDSDYWKNGNDERIQSGKYNCELWIRRAGNTEYELISTFKNGKYVNDEYGHGSGTVNIYDFTQEDQVVGYYILIKDMRESLISKQLTSLSVRFKKESIPQNGILANFAYMQVYLKDSNGDLILQNEPSESSYSSFIAKDIATYDKQTYGHYMQRDTSNARWSYYKAELSPTLIAFKSSNDVTQNAENEYFSGSFNIGFKFSGDDYYEIYEDQYDKSQTISNIYLYDILPSGLELTSSKEDIINSLVINKKNEFRYLNKTIVSDKDFEKIIRDNLEIKIIPNYLKSARTKIEINIDLTDTPLFVCDSTSSKRTEILFSYDYQLSYDNYLDYGNRYNNYLYIYGLKGDNTEASYSQSTKINDDGSIDNIAYDINQNGKTDEKMAYVNSEVIISSVVSSYQDVQTQTSSTLSNYSTGTIPAEYGKDYSYKLRVRSGENDVTNLVIYDNLEKWAKDKDGNFIESAGNKEYWQGEFLGVDTSYAESKGYTVKVWYSENEKAENLSEDNSWKEYSDSIDKTKVKSLAFQYLDAEGNPAVLPANSLTYVVINMKAPADESITTLAYNGCWTQWNALDEFGQPVDFITGINSNIVKVALPNSVDENSKPSIQLNIEKEIQGTSEAFENMLLDPNGEYQFMISLVRQEENEDGSHDVINGVISNKRGIVIKDLSYGTWLIQELDDTYFDLVEIISLADPEITTPGVTFEKTDAGYILTINEDIDSATEYSLKVINEIEPERFYEDKDSEVNLFNGTPLVEEQSLLDKLINFFE